MQTIKLAVNGISMLSPLTGIGQYTRSLFEEIGKRQDVEVFFFYGTSWGRSPRGEHVPGIGMVKTLVKRLVPNPYAVTRFLQQRRFTRGCRRYAVDLYHEPGFLPFQTKRPIVVTVHDLSHRRFPAGHPPERVAYLERHLARAMESARRILTDSEFVRREVITEYGIASDKVHAVPLGVADRFEPMDEARAAPALREYGLTYKRYLLAVGTLEPRKNLLQVLRAYSTLPAAVRSAYPLAIAGMRGWLTRELDKTVAAMARHGEVRPLGYVPERLLPGLYAGAYAFLYPSLYEGFGLPPLEAMASGVPVIVSNRASIPEVVGDAGIQVEPEDVDAIAEAVTRLTGDPAECARRVAAGLARARGFTWARCAQRTMEIYRCTLGG